jgi:hypothetical protein
MEMRRWLLLAILGAAGFVAVAHSARAALFLIFNRQTAPIGTSVSARTPMATNAVLRKLLREGVLRKHPLRVFLAPDADVASIRSVRDPRLTPVGAVHVDRRGRGRLTFSMPNVAPGEYRTLLQCVPCRTGAPARALVPSGPFRNALGVVDGPPLLRDCSTSVGGDLPSDWRRYTVAAGPLTLYYWNASTLTNSGAFRARAPGRYEPIKILALVSGPRTVTLSVPLGERRKVALVYGPVSERRQAIRVSDGRAATTFQGCPFYSDSEDTQFNGGFVVAGAQCATFDVRVEGLRDAMKLSVPFGTSC